MLNKIIFIVIVIVIVIALRSQNIFSFRKSKSHLHSFNYIKKLSTSYNSVLRISKLYRASNMFVSTCRVIGTFSELL